MMRYAHKDAYTQGDSPVLCNMAGLITDALVVYED